MQLTSRRSGGAAGAWARPRASTPWALGAVGALLLLVFWLDRATDAAPVQHLYYVPIVIAAVAFGYHGALAAGLAAVVLYHLANPAVVARWYQPTDLLQIVLFVAVGLVSARVATDARRLRLLAMTDDLTGLHNLRSFEAGLRELLTGVRERRAPLSMLVLDVDRLKSINDEHGHLAGAEAVQVVGRIIAARIQPPALACRYGGDEFVVALPDCGEAPALEAADALRRSVHEAAPLLAGQAFPAGTLSVSVGIATTSFVDDTAWSAGAGESLFRAADAALYAAKGSGRNCAVAAETA